MKQSILSVLGAMFLVTLAFAETPSPDIAGGNVPLNMDVNEMDINHDGMISKEEFAAYGEKIWKRISHGKKTVPVNTAAVDFASGNMGMKVEDMDTDHDGTISHKEFMDYGAKTFDQAAGTSKMLTLTETTKYFATGNMRP